jgi:hypothetical protein
MSPLGTTRMGRIVRAVLAGVLACSGASVVGVAAGHGLNATLGNGCAAAAGVHHVTLVVTHGDGSTLTFCDAFSGATIGGEQVLADSRFEYAVQHFGSGDEVCQVDKEPGQYAICLGTGDYWTLFTSRTAAAGPWTYSQVGISSLILSDGQAEGLRYDPENRPTPPSSPAGVCPAPVPSATARPTPVATGTHAASTPPTTAPRGTAAAATPPGEGQTAIAAAAPPAAAARSPGGVAALTTGARTGGDRGSPAAPLLAGSLGAALVALLGVRVVQGRRR